MRRAMCALLITVLAVGCGGAGGELPVHGIVRMDGKPLDGASVTFYADEKSGETGGTARTGSDGKFVVVGAKGQRGLVPGSYKVTVSKIQGGPVTDEEVIAAPSEDEIVAIQRSDEIPPVYSDPTRTVLSFSVTGDGQPIEIELDSERKE